jgi:hypothetical protein
MKQNVDPATVPRSRRSLLAAVAGAAATIAAASLGRPVPVAPADGDPLLLEQQNQADTLTELVGGSQIPRGLAVSNDTPSGGTANSTAISAGSLHGRAVSGSSVGGFGTASSGVSGTAENADGVGVSAFNIGLGTALYVSGKAQWLRGADARRSWRADRRSIST